MGYKVLVTDEIDRIAVKILKETCEVAYEPVLTAADLVAIIKDYDAIMIRSASRITKDVLNSIWPP